MTPLYIFIVTKLSFLLFIFKKFALSKKISLWRIGKKRRKKIDSENFRKGGIYAFLPDILKIGMGFYRIFIKIRYFDLFLSHIFEKKWHFLEFYCIFTTYFKKSDTLIPICLEN